MKTEYGNKKQPIFISNLSDIFIKQTKINPTPKKKNYKQKINTKIPKSMDTL